MGIPILVLVASIGILSISLCIKVYYIVFKGSRNRVRSTTEESIEGIGLGIDYNSSSNRFAPVNSDSSCFPANLSYKCINIFAGFYEGLSLILRHRYTMYLFAVSTLYEIVLTILDYQFKILGADYSTTALPHRYRSLSILFYTLIVGYQLNYLSVCLYMLCVLSIYTASLSPLKNQR